MGVSMNLVLSMSVFRRVAETESFSETAREMGHSQPTISKHISALEKHLNVKLLNRNTRQLSLTEIGREYYVQCTHILDEIAATEATIKNHQSVASGTLRINLPVTFGEIEIMPKIWRFMELYPALKLDVIMVDHYIDLVKEGVDCTIRVGPLTDSGLIARKIGSFERITVATPEYLAQYGEPTRLNELINHECIVFTLLTTANEWHFTGPYGHESVNVQGHLSINNPRVMCDAVLEHAGIAVIPMWLIRGHLKAGKLKSILTDYEPKPMEIHVLYPQRQYVPAKVRCFIDFLMQEFTS